MSFPALRSLVAAAAVAIVFTTGCANNFTPTATRTAAAAGSLAGSVHGGQQPIVGSTITLYAAGTTGYGTGATQLGAAVTTDAHGGFTYGSYTCPSANAPVYLIASGGYTNGTPASGTPNSAAVLMAALGGCQTSMALNNVVVTEVTTVASVFALAQYINPGSTTPGSAVVGGPGDYTASTLSQAATGLLNASNNVPLLANIATGAAVTSTSIAGTGTAAAATVTATPETQKINTIANILAACVNNTNSSHGQCDTLFNNATQPSPTLTSQPGATFAKAVDTLQAAYYMATNPTDGSVANLTALFNNASASAPFGNNLAAQPTDWTLGLLFSSGTSTCTTPTTSLFINYPYALSIDSVGAVWLANGGSSTAGSTTKMGANGQPQVCSAAIFGSRGGAVIDASATGFVWSTSNTTAAVYKIDPTAGTTTTITAAGKTYGMAADGTGNVFFTVPASPGPALYELPSAATSSTTPTSIGSIAGASPYDLAVDTRGTVITGQSGSSGSTLSTTEPTTVGGFTYATPANLTAASNFAGVYDLAVDASGNFWVSNSAGTSAGSSSASSTGPGNTTSYITPTYASTTAGATNTVTFAESTASAVYAGGLSTARGVAIDGAGNVWFANNTAASSGLYAVSEFSNAGAALSPTSVTNGTNSGGFTTATQNGGFQKAATFFSALRGIAIDPSGNVWTSSTNSTSSSILTEIVGAAVPVVTPIAAQLKSGKGPVKP